mmetsp:Transcript_22050/g.70996  ORF Transcript_22050/g.70996 Transcript_22050/m.70996 type:complete len:131 (+) Transcript_22050:63-455(+)
MEEDLEALAMRGLAKAKKKKRKVDLVALEASGWNETSLEAEFAKSETKVVAVPPVAEAETKEPAAVAKAVVVAAPSRPHFRPKERRSRDDKARSRFDSKERRTRTARGENDYVQEEKRILRQRTDGYGLS